MSVWGSNLGYDGVWGLNLSYFLLGSQILSRMICGVNILTRAEYGLVSKSSFLRPLRVYGDSVLEIYLIEKQVV